MVSSLRIHLFFALLFILVPGNSNSNSNSLYPDRLKRSKFTDEQVEQLNEIFLVQTYLSLKERHMLAIKLKLTEGQVKNWFQNKRMKTKREYIQAIDKGYVIPIDKYELPRFSRLPVDYFLSLPVSPIKMMTHIR